MTAIGLKSTLWTQRLYRWLGLARIMLAMEKASRWLRHDEPRVFYRYRHAVRPALHPLFRISYTRPPLRYSTMGQAQLYHWWHSPDAVDETPFVLEPIDHALSPSRQGEPIDALERRDEVESLYSDERCRRLLLSSSGQLEIFRHYYPELEHKFTVVRPGCLPHPPARRSTGENPVFLCIASGYQLKAVDLVVNAWRATETGSARLILVCPDMPDDRQPREGESGFELISSSRPLSARRIVELYAHADVAIVSYHIDGLNAYVEALTHGLPIITMQGQHASECTAEGAGIVCGVPLEFYDPEGYGIRWRTWSEFFAQVSEAKREGAFDVTVQQMSRAMKDLIDPTRRREMANRSQNLGATRFHIDTRNRQLREIYEASL
jgi:hypothetical protein